MGSAQKTGFFFKKIVEYQENRMRGPWGSSKIQNIHNSRVHGFINKEKDRSCEWAEWDFHDKLNPVYDYSNGTLPMDVGQPAIISYKFDTSDTIYIPSYSQNENLSIVFDNIHCSDNFVQSEW